MHNYSLEPCKPISAYPLIKKKQIEYTFDSINWYRGAILFTDKYVQLISNILYCQTEKLLIPYNIQTNFKLSFPEIAYGNISRKELEYKIAAGCKLL